MKVHGFCFITIFKKWSTLDCCYVNVGFGFYGNLISGSYFLTSLGGYTFGAYCFLAPNSLFIFYFTLLSYYYNTYSYLQYLGWNLLSKSLTI